MKKVVQDLTSGGLLGVWGKWVKHTKYIYNIQDFNPEQVLAVGYTKSKFITDAMMWFDKFSCKRSDLVITVGRDLVETVENRFKGKKVPKTVMENLLCGHYMIAGPLRDIVATTVWWDARNGLMVVMIVSKFMHILKVCLSITQKITMWYSSDSL